MHIHVLLLITLSDLCAALLCFIKVIYHNGMYVTLLMASSYDCIHYHD